MARRPNPVITHHHMQKQEGAARAANKFIWSPNLSVVCRSCSRTVHSLSLDPVNKTGAAWQVRGSLNQPRCVPTISCYTQVEKQVRDTFM